MHKLWARILLVVLVKVAIAWAEEFSTCGRLPQINSPHLTHSNPTGHWPWHATIFHRHTNSSSTYECGGTVISAHWILTAAHCVSRGKWSMGPNEILVSLGRLNLAEEETRTEQSFNVTTIVQHEKYDPIYYENDIALLRLSHSATFNHFVRPICLWKSNKTEISHVTNKLGTVVGWGITEKYEVSDTLQEVHFEVMSHLECLLSNREFFGTFLTKTNFCAGLRNGTSVCKGDSGGSMVFEEDGKYYIRGIVSSSPSKRNITTNQYDCDTMEYGIYTDVAMYLQWIGNIIGLGCQTEVRCNREGLWGKLDDCIINVHPTKVMCKIVFNEISDSGVKKLHPAGYFESIPDVSDALSIFENLEELGFESNKLIVVERGRLSAYRSIKTLSLSFNQIAHLDADSFDDLKILRSLSLSYNEISKLHPDLFRELDDLKVVHLEHNKIEILPHGLFRDNLQLYFLSLAENQLKEIPDDAFSGLYDLSTLNLERNQLEILPKGLFSDNRNLEKIFLTENRIKKIESDVSHLSKLSTLDMRKNVCIDENLYNFYFNFGEYLNKIRTKCSV